jgi:Plant specific mitochondrial import receptor subunit TOM20
MGLCRSIDEIAETLQNAKVGRRACTLLIGAGVSVTAGIPTAGGFVDEIRKRFPVKFGQTPDPKTYPRCMAQLLVDERRRLISEFVDGSRINWAHVAIALLIQNGYVDRVLTTNFDPLVAKACSLLGIFPAVYDFAASQMFKPASLPDQAVFHLHGQRTGFVILNTDKEVERLSKASAPVFEDAGRGRTWIVAGYSGENDPVFNHLATVPTFDNGLYWICYKDAEPAEHVRAQLLSEDKSAFYVLGFDADSFFVTLSQRLGIFPPKLIARPFTHLDRILEMLTPYQLPGQSAAEDVTRPARDVIARAIVQFEEQVTVASINAQSGADPQNEGLPDAIVAAATELVMSGQYREALAFKKVYEKREIPELGDMLAWAHVMNGHALAQQLGTTQNSDSHYTKVGEECAAALALKPDMHEAYNIWGNTLGDQARTKTGEEADRLFNLAGEKYAAALAIKPDKHDALYNWGITLGDLARTKTGEEADRLFNLAGEKYAAALAIKPDRHDALYNWGIILGDQARTKTGEEADRLFNLAGEKYAAALAIKPDKDQALYNWGNTLGAQARTKTGEEADRLFNLAGEKYAAALAIKPDEHDALFNWGNILGDQAKTKTGEEADRLFNLAGEKYAAALAIKPDDHEALNNWGNTLGDQARTKTGEEADRLFNLAGEKYAAALTIKADEMDYLKSWAMTLEDQARTKSGSDAERLRALAQAKRQLAESLRHPG